MSDTIVNKVSDSALVTINLEEFLPKNSPLVFDLKEFLHMGLILKEKDYREALKQLDWSAYAQQTVLVTCSADAIIPVWAYMLAAAYLKPVATSVSLESLHQWKTSQLLDNIRNMDVSSFSDKRIVVKGCGEEDIPDAAYLEITAKLQPTAKSIMYGEPCSTVPIYKQKTN
jgi:hypothetical protein